MPSQREHHWDFMRAFYLLLGIPFHAAVGYSLSHDWTVPSPQRDQFLTWVADGIHTFRMPGFFVIAGYFSMMILARQGARRWLAGRFLRLGVPLLTATLTILPVQVLIAAWAEVLAGSISTDAYWSTVIFRLTHFDEPWVSHLWFLYSLLIYSVALAGLAMIFGEERFARLARQAVAFANSRRWLSFAVLAGACAVAALVMPEIYARFGQKLSAIAGYLQYWPFFGLGVAIYLSAEVRTAYGRIGSAGLLAGVGLAAASTMQTAAPLASAAALTAGILGALLITGAITHLARRRFSAENTRIRRIADASFTIYLFHHPIMFVLAAGFAQLTWPPVAEFAVMVPVAAVLSYQVHRLIAAHPLAAFLFNGVKPGRAQSREITSPVSAVS